MSFMLSIIVLILANGNPFLFTHPAGGAGVFTELCHATQKTTKNIIKNDWQLTELLIIQSSKYGARGRELFLGTCDRQEVDLVEEWGRQAADGRNGGEELLDSRLKTSGMTEGDWRE